MKPLIKSLEPGTLLFHENDRSRERYSIRSGSMFIRQTQSLFAHSLRNISKLFLFLCPLLIVVTNATICIGEEYVGSHISKDTRWNADEGPYILDRDLVIDKGASLTISPGVKIIIKKPKVYDTITQYDATDSALVSIKVKGALNCVGQEDRRITFVTANQQSNSYGWYGIVFDNAPENFTEIAFADIANAYRGISVKESSPVIRNLILEYNHIGIYCSTNGNARIYNCVITRNFVSGIHVREANPHIANCIIAFNKNNGVLCDGLSVINFEYNCVYGNTDGNFLDCNPELENLLSTNKKNKNQTDYAHNIYVNPIFTGSIADSLAEEKDISLPTEKFKIKDTTLANVYYSDKDSIHSTAISHKKDPGKYSLSPYSPCINTGLPDAEFKNTNGSQNTMGIWGGPQFFVDKDKKTENTKTVGKPKPKEKSKEKEKEKQKEKPKEKAKEKPKHKKE
jgi:hypothetical protein